MNSLAETPATAENEASETSEVVTNDVPASPESAPEESAIAKMQKRIDKITWEKNQYLRELQQFRARPEAPKEPPAPAKPPSLEENGFDEAKYQAAMLEYLRAEARREAAEALKQEKAAEQKQHAQSEFEKRAGEFAKSNPDWHEKVIEGAQIGAWACSPEMAEIIHESENGPALALYLASNAEKSKMIASLPPILQAREMGKIEASLEVKKAAPPVVTKAPPPPPKIEATTPEPDETDPSKMTDAQFRKWRRKQIAQRR